MSGRAQSRPYLKLSTALEKTESYDSKLIDTSHKSTHFEGDLEKKCTFTLCLKFIIF